MKKFYYDIEEFVEEKDRLKENITSNKYKTIKFKEKLNAAKNEKKLKEKVNNNKNTKKLNLIQKAAIAYTICGIISSCGMIYNLAKPKLVKSPFDGNSIVITQDDLDLEIKDVYNVLYPNLTENDIQKILNNKSEKEKKDLLLFSSLLENKEFDNEDIKYLKGYLKYLNDNNYVNYEKTYKLIKSAYLSKNQKLYNARGNYNPRINKIKLEDKTALPHEFFHLEDMYINNSEKDIFNTEQNWFMEGTAEVLSCEYITNDNTSYPVQCSAIRCLAELLGSDKILEARSKGDFDIITDALEEKGISRKESEELFSLLEQHLKYYKMPNLTSSEINAIYNISIEISNRLLKIYMQIRNTTIISPIYEYNLKNIINNDVEDYNAFNYYLFNKEKQDNQLINRKAIDENGKIVYEEYYDDYKIRYKDNDKQEKITYEYDQNKDEIVETIYL